MSISQMSFSGAVMILVIVLIRALALHRLPKNTFWALWCVTLARLLIPFPLPFVFSVYSLAGRLAPATENTKNIPTVTVAHIRPLESTPHTAQDPAPVVRAAEPLVVVWLLGVLFSGVFFAATYFRCRREFQSSLPIDNDYTRVWLQTHPLRRTLTIRQSDRISAPLTYGVFHPVILMPKTTDWSDQDSLAYVLYHEYVHIRRLDAVAKLVLTTALCVHWFNPMVWIMYVLANRDIELSCDEAVIRMFGERTKSAYAMTLIRMEETKISNTPMCSNFSKNAIEERIVAVMKIKKTSRAATVVALTLVAGVTTGFATSAQAESVVSASSTEDDKLYDTKTVTAYVDKYDGKTYYSDDNGITWQQGEPFEVGYNAKIDWWTAEEYEAWLEDVKKEYQSMLGERSWTPSTGWFTWTQERIDEAIEGNEQLLEDIKNGKMVSKPTADGDEMIQYSYDPRAAQAVTETSDVIVTSDDAQNAKLIADSKWFHDYEKYGLSYDAQHSTLIYNGQTVGSFHDETAPGVFTHVTFDQGEIGIEVERNADWKVTGINVRAVPLSGTAVYESPVSADDTEFFDESVQEPTQEELLSSYGAFGVTFDDSGRMLYKNKPIRWFADFVEIEDGMLATQYVYHNDEGTEYIHTIRDRIYNGDGSYDPFGPVKDIVPWEKGEFDKSGFLFQGNNIAETTEVRNSDTTGGTTFAERFAKYSDYGITFVETAGASGVGNVYLNGRLVSRFSDITPEGGAFSFTSAEPGGINVRMRYDRNGKITGAEIVD